MRHAFLGTTLCTIIPFFICRLKNCMFTLILPTWLRETTALTVHTPALDAMLQFGQFTPQPQTTGQLYLHYVCHQLSLPENEVFASPVCLQMGMNSMTMTDGAAIQIGVGEAQSLCDGLNEFYQREFYFEPIRADLWRFRLPEPPQWQSPMLFDMCGYQIGDLSEQAQGSRRNEWLQLHTEIQMWLYDHPLNKVRQKNGYPPINGVWLWQPPAPSQSPHLPKLLGSNSVWKNHAAVLLHAAPDGFLTWQNICRQQNISVNDTALFLDDLRLLAQMGDEQSYQLRINEWERHFFAPIWAALKSGALPEMQIVCEHGTLRVGKRAHWRFWKARRKFTGKLA